MNKNMLKLIKIVYLIKMIILELEINKQKILHSYQLTQILCNEKFSNEKLFNLYIYNITSIVD